MDVFNQLHVESLHTVEGIMTDQQERLIENAEEVKNRIKTAFGTYMEWLRERETVLVRNVDRAVESYLSRSQNSLCEAVISLKTLKDSVELIDPEGTPRDIKDQIERLLQDMTSAIAKDLKVIPVVKFEENGKTALRSVIDNCGEVFTQTKDVLNPFTKTTSTSKWSNWLQSTVNLEDLEEPELPYDFDDLGSMMSVGKMISQSSRVDSTERSKKPEPVVSVPEKVVGEKDITHHFDYLMTTPLDQWLQKSAQLASPPKKRTERIQICPGETGKCSHADATLEIESLDQLHCISPTVPKDLQTWLMQPDVVQLPPIAEICRANQPCQSLSECASTSNHCLNYFFTLSRRSEDWLASEVPSSASSIATQSDAELLGDNTDMHSNISGKLSSCCSDEFEILSSASTTRKPSRKSSVSGDLKAWLKPSSIPSSDCCEWLTSDCCQNGKIFDPSSSKLIEEWLLKSQ